MGSLTCCSQFPAGRRTLLAFRLLLAFAAFFLATHAAVLRAASFTASLTRDTITLGESAQLTLTIEGASPDGVPTLPPIPNTRTAYGGESSQFSLVNGTMTASMTYTFALTPTQAGEILIPALRASAGGKVLMSQPLKLKVLKPDAPPVNAAAVGQSLAFLRLMVPKQSIFLGETVTAELQLYIRDGVQDVRGFDVTGTPADGLLLGKQVQGQQRRAQVGNTMFTVVPFALPLTATKTGPLSIGPITCSTVLALPNNRRGRDPFDMFGMFSQPNYQRLALATEEVKLQGLALPTQDVPPGFSGAVGNFTLSVSAGPTNVAVGDPITVKIQISGRGAIDTLPQPPLAEAGWRDFNTYPPTSKTDLADPLGLQGTKSFEQVVTPKNTEVKQLPPIAFSFFDPDAKAYRTLTHPAVALTVRPGGSFALPTLPGVSNAVPGEKPPPQDIVGLKPRLGRLSPDQAPLVQRPGFLGLQATPVLVWLALLVWRKRTDALANNPRLRRQRQVAHIIHDGLAQLRQLADENDSDEFFATLFRLLQEQLGERLDLPATAITEAVVEERLRPRGVPAETLEPLQELFQMCNLARYAPMRSRQELSAVIPKLDALLRELQALEV